MTASITRSTTTRPTLNGTGDDDNIKILGLVLPTPAQTYYVDCGNGDDANTITQAKNAATPWRTIKKALQIADGGDTVSVLPGLCGEAAIESQRDARSRGSDHDHGANPGHRDRRPSLGNGFLIGHNYHTLSGLIVTGATANGIQIGPHDVGEAPSPVLLSTTAVSTTTPSPASSSPNPSRAACSTA